MLLTLRHRLQRSSLVLLAWLVLCTQTLGLLHRTVHGPALGPGAGLHRLVQGADEPPAHASPWAGLFGHAAAHNDCRLYDQLSGGDAQSTVHAQPLPAALPVAPLPACARSHSPPVLPAFAARAPPALA